MATAFRNHPTVLVLETGLLAGGVYLLAKVLAGSGTHPAWMLVSQSVVAGTGLTLLALSRGRIPISAAHLRFYFLAGLSSLTLPNFVGFLALREISAGLYSLLIAVTPLATWLLSSVSARRLEQPIRLIGIVVGFFGVTWILTPSVEGAGSTYLLGVTSLSLLLGISVPALIAIGNVYRSLRLPRDASVLAIAGGTLLSQAPVALGIVITTDAPMIGIQDIPILALLGISTLVMYLPYFRLQVVATAVQFSQIGYVISLTGVMGGALLLGETLPSALLVGVPLVFLGLAITNGHLDSRQFLPKNLLRKKQ